MIFNLLFAALAAFSSGSLPEKIHNDISLIVPGAGSEKIVLKENAETIINIKGYPDSVSEFTETKDAIRHIFNEESGIKIPFNKIYYYKNQKSVFFINNSVVTGIAGLTNSRITSDSIDLRKGIEYFIFGYGNNKLTVLTKSGDKNRDRIYLYPEAGIAVIDDGDDDVIDMYIVFPKTKTGGTE